MKLLWMGNSGNAFGAVPEESRSHSVAARILSEAAGEPVEVILKRAWPTPDFPSIVERWMGRYEPDAAFIHVPAYWFMYESVPLKLERKFKRVGKPLGDAGLRAAKVPWLAGTPVFRAGRKLAQLTIGGATNFEPEQVVESVSAALRVMVRSEDLALVVRGPRNAVDFSASRRRRAWGEARRQIVERSLRELCEDLHLVYYGSETSMAGIEERTQLFDGLHSDEADHIRLGETHGALLAQAWIRVRQPA
jgi:hypothetical protein